eukprot:1215321-Amorphochlora_amoeboformis.AAC.1
MVLLPLSVLLFWGPFSQIVGVGAAEAAGEMKTNVDARDPDVRDQEPSMPPFLRGLLTGGKLSAGELRKLGDKALSAGDKKKAISYYSK